MEFIKKYFQFEQKNTSFKKEIIAGFITFLAMSYILIVNPSMLSEGGMSFSSVYLATSISAAIGSILLGIYAKVPISQASGMGLNALFTYTLIINNGYTYQEALFCVFISGLLFVLISFSKFKDSFVNMIPTTLKHAISVGIGFFIAFLGFQNAKIIISDPATLLKLGDLTNPLTLLAIISLIISIFFLIKKNNLGIFYTILITILLAFIMQFGLNINLGLTFNNQTLNFDFSNFFQLFNIDVFKLFSSFNFWIFVFSLLIVDMFDTTGTLFAANQELNFNEKQMTRSFQADALGTVIGSVCGTSSVTSFVESLSGIISGGKTGFVSIITGLLFLLSIFFLPLLNFINPIIPALTFPSLVIVGIMMSKNIQHIDFNDLTNAIVCFITILTMILTFSISNGIAFGFISYIICSLFNKKYSDIPPLMYIISFFFILHFII